mgnify:CR=1 FL=1
MSTRITIQVDSIPEVEEFPDSGEVKIGGWWFDLDIPITAEDVAAFAAAKAYFEQHPELVPDE